MLAFAIKKWIGAFLQPLPLITAFMLIALLLHLRGHRRSGISMQLMALMCLLVVATPPASTYFIKQTETDYPPFTESMMVDYIVVLGCGHHNNSNRSITSQLHSCSLYRTTEGVRIYNENPNSTLVFSGYGGSELKSNAQTNKEMALALGVPESHILIEPRARDTKEEAMLLAPMLKNKQFALVTSASHMPRAVEYFRQQRLYPLPAPTGHLYRDNENLPARAYLPNSSALHNTEVSVYEQLGKLWQRINSD